jgi:HTH-type transcriptional regulator/antitoxin HigA
MRTGTNINQLTPAMAIHPGEILMDELNERGIKQKDFAAKIGYAQTQLNEVIKGKRNITADLALLIAKALDMQPETWMNLQAGYELDVAKIQTKTQQRLEAIDAWKMIEQFIPVSFFKKENIITGNTINDLIAVKQIYKVEHLEQFSKIIHQPEFESHFRKSEKLSVEKVNLVGWSYLVQHKADEISVPKFNSQTKDELVAELKAIFKKNKKTITQVEKLLANYGIKLIVQKHPEKCSVDGISFWSYGNAAIGLSLRHHRLDNFAFTLMHELGHVYLHLTSNNKAQFIDIDKQNQDAKEKEANEFAGNHLIDKQTWDDFLLNTVKPDDTDFTDLAKKQKIHPAIVLGKYCHQFNSYGMRTKIDKTLN